MCALFCNARQCRRATPGDKPDDLRSDCESARERRRDEAFWPGWSSLGHIGGRDLRNTVGSYTHDASATGVRFVLRDFLINAVLPGVIPCLPFATPWLVQGYLRPSAYWISLGICVVSTATLGVGIPKAVASPPWRNRRICPPDPNKVGSVARFPQLGTRRVPCLRVVYY